MSDEEDVYVKKIRTIHYGSLEDSEKARLTLEATEDNSNEGTSSAPQNTQVHVSSGK